MSSDHFKQHATRVMTKSTTTKTQHRRTPKVIIDLVRQVFGGKIDLDPCASRFEKYWFAKNNYTGKPKDGLTKAWNYAHTFVNPPYGREIKAWIEKAVIECCTARTLGLARECILLVPARVDTVWFQEKLLPHMDAICFWKGRLKFRGKGIGDTPAPFPVLLCYIGHRRVEFCRVFGEHGWVMHLGTIRAIAISGDVE